MAGPTAVIYMCIVVHVLCCDCLYACILFMFITFYISIEFFHFIMIIYEISTNWTCLLFWHLLKETLLLRCTLDYLGGAGSRDASTLPERHNHGL